jgi:membrane fusion protein (multidrug efflux system)
MAEQEMKTLQNTPPKTNSGTQSIEDVPALKKKRVIIPIFISMVIVVIGGWSWYAHNSYFIGTDDAAIDANHVTISAKMMGRIVSLKFDEGDTVKQGDTLAKLDDTDLNAQLSKAEASVRYFTKSAEISTVNLEKTKNDFARAEKQYDSKIITQEQYDHAGDALKLAQAQADMALSQIVTSQADIKIISTQINNSVILAPFTGVIAKKWMMQGDVVQPGQAIFSLYDTRNIWVTANYEETKIHSINPGMNVDITLDAFPGKILKGKVLWIGKTTAAQFSLMPANNASGNFTKITQRVPVRIVIDTTVSPKDVALIPGLSSTVRILVR